MKINFVIIGAQKSGTTSLSYQLSQHPQINFCKHKEPDFFSKQDNWKANIPDYHNLYNFENGKFYGEASTTYTWLPQYPDTVSRLFEYNPDLKLIYIMRNPIKRILSHYTHELFRARTKFPIDEEVFENPTYINRSRYAVQLRPYIDAFGLSNFKLIIFEEYIKNPQKYLGEIAEFLGINANGFEGIDLDPQYQSSSRSADRRIKRLITPFIQFIPVKIRNALRGPFVYKLDKKIDISEKTKYLLWQFLMDDVIEIEKIIEKKLDFWEPL